MVREEKEQSELPSKNEEFKYSEIQENQNIVQSNNQKSFKQMAENTPE